MSVSLKKDLRSYEEKDTGKALIHLLTSLPFALILFVANYQFVVLDLYLFFAIGVMLQVAFLTRLFMILHDCGHNSFVVNNKHNVLLGKLIGVVMLVPLDLWKVIHNKHHAGAGNLDERSILDVVTLTVEEYYKLNWLYRVAYRIFRSAWFQLLVYQQVVFLIGFRIPYSFYTKKGQIAVMKNNVFYILLGIMVYYFLDWKAFLLSLTVVYYLTFGLGSYIFFIQHQFEEAYWKKADQFDFDKAGIEGSSYWKLPALLGWITADIGYHHIHHLNIGIPNYKLAEAHDEVIAKSSLNVPTLDLLSSFTLFKYKLYDTQQNKMIPFP
ncbi:fatty acid desaturase [Saprospiraceae bacterium]|nr:fatty acid desaturase [Saprospiraceae bacterium]